MDDVRTTIQILLELLQTLFLAARMCRKEGRQYQAGQQFRGLGTTTNINQVLVSSLLLKILGLKKSETE